MVNEFELGILKNFGTVISLPHPFPSFDTIQLSTCMRFISCEKNPRRIRIQCCHVIIKNVKYIILRENFKRKVSNH